MTVMRKELRALLTWCLAQPGKFRSKDAAAHLNAPRTSVGAKLRRLEALGFLRREIVNQTIHHFTVINRKAAKAAAQTVSPTAHLKSQINRDGRRIRHTTSAFTGVNSIFSAAQKVQAP